ncbi:hypothetical protein [Cetobacterium ceti]
MGKNKILIIFLVGILGFLILPRERNLKKNILKIGLGDELSRNLIGNLKINFSEGQVEGAFMGDC